MAQERLVQRIYQLLLKDPHRRWSYGELAHATGCRVKVISARCRDLLNLSKIERLMVPTGKLRGRMALVSIKRPDIEYPSWLCPGKPAATPLRSTLSKKHILEQ
jgi:hypothetical protein